jgi:hypothetical protein
MSFDTSQLSGMNGDAKRIILAHKSRIGRLEERLAVVEGERDRARATAVALEQDGAMAHHALVILADAVLAEVDHNTTVYSKALAVQRIAGGTA